MRKIEFCGLLSGTAAEFFWKKSVNSGQKIMLSSIAIVSPWFAFVSLKLGNFIPLLVCGILFVLTPLLVRLPKDPKEKKKLTPNMIYVEDDCIICVSNGYLERKYIDDATCVFDHGEFYEFVFPFGKVSDKFICQKSLITTGTLEEFESIIGNKLHRKNL